MNEEAENHSLKSNTRSSWPDNLTDSFHRARRNLVLFSSLLLCWEFLGLQTGSSIKAPVVNTSVDIANPDNLPVLILIMVIYSLFRFFIEWYQCDPNRRSYLAARADFYISNLIAISSITLFLYQTIANVNIFENLPQDHVIFTLLLLITMVVVGHLLGRFIGLTACDYLNGSRFKVSRYSICSLIVVSFLIMLHFYIAKTVFVGGFFSSFFNSALVFLIASIPSTAYYYRKNVVYKEY